MSEKSFLDEIVPLLEISRDADRLPEYLSGYDLERVASEIFYHLQGLGYVLFKEPELSLEEADTLTDIRVASKDDDEC